MTFTNLKVINIANLKNYKPSFSRKDLYRICLVKGKSSIYYSDRRVDMSGTYLFFGNINTPYSWILGEGKQEGYSCLFTENYIKDVDYVSRSIKSLSVFDENAYPVYPLSDEKQIAYISFLFEQIKEQNTGRYAYQKDILRSLLLLLTHEAFKFVQEDFEANYVNKSSSSKRLFADFTNLLNSQFPVESKEFPLQLTSVSGYANKLSVHPNYLNRIVKTQTGQTVLKIINERIIKEAKILLQHTDWSISEIAYSLGFEYPSYFDNIFKKITLINPKQYRQNLLQTDSKTI